jgi:hypothetical protein
MCHTRQITRSILLVGLLVGPCFAFTHLGNGNKVGVVDVYIQTYAVNGQDAPSYTDEHGNLHESGKEYYLSTAVKGTMGGPVKYRFFLEHVNLTSPESPDSTHRKYDTDNPPVFQSSKAEMIDSAGAAGIAPGIFSKLPDTFTNPKRR